MRVQQSVQYEQPTPPRYPFSCEIRIIQGQLPQNKINWKMFHEYSLGKLACRY